MPTSTAQTLPTPTSPKANLDRANLQAANLFGTDFTDADIRTTQLPEAESSPYTDVALNLLIQGQQADTSLEQNAQKTVLVERPIAEATRNPAAAAATIALRQSLLTQMRVHLASLAPEKPSSMMLRQEAIRQSAAPYPAKRVAKQAVTPQAAKSQAA